MWRKGGICIVGELLAKTEKLTPEVFKERIGELLGRRDRHDIIVEILKAAKKGEKKTCIMSKVRLSHSQLKLYLGYLNQNGMIVNDNGVYKTTPKGLAYIQEFESIHFMFRQ
jgi:predicted transcriptional regulator